MKNYYSPELTTKIQEFPIDGCCTTTLYQSQEKGRLLHHDPQLYQSQEKGEKVTPFRA